MTLPINKKDFIIKAHLLNSINEVYNKLYPTLLNALEPYLNKKIIINSRRGSFKFIKELQTTFKEIEEKNLKKIENNLKPLNITQTNTHKNFINLDYYLFINHFNIFREENFKIWLKLKLNINGGSYEDKTSYCIYQSKDFYLCEAINKELIKIEPFKKQKVLNINKEYEKYLKAYNQKIKLEKQLNKFEPYELQEFIKESFKIFYVD